MDEISAEELSAYVVWVPRLGGTEGHVPEASSLIMNDRTRHYWDGEEALGSAYRDVLKLGIDAPAWDIYFIYDAGVEWGDDAVPEPQYWEHQLRGVTAGPHLDGDVFRAQVTQALQRARAGQ